MRELVGDDLGGDRVVGLKVLDGLVRKNHAPAKRYARRVAFEHGDVVGGIPQLHRNREIEPGWTGADAGNLHATRHRSSRSSLPNARAQVSMRISLIQSAGEKNIGEA